jgi:hypothetical protein
MKLRELQWVGLATVLTTVFAAAVVADGSRPSQRVLNEMGLGGLAVMSDDEAMNVRGHGFKLASSVNVFGNSFATFDTPLGTSHSENGYAAEGNHFAFGKNYSEAGIKANIGNAGGDQNPRPNSSRRGGTSKVGGRIGAGSLGIPSGVTIKVFAGGYSVGAAL